MGIEWILSALAVTIAALALVLSLYSRVKNVMRNDLKHIHQRIDAVQEDVNHRIDEVQEDVTDLRERSSAVERDVSWLKLKQK